MGIRVRARITLMVMKIRIRTWFASKKAGFYDNTRKIVEEKGNKRAVENTSDIDTYVGGQGQRKWTVGRLINRTRTGDKRKKRWERRLGRRDKSGKRKGQRASR